jgi:hypothetical protein
MKTLFIGFFYGLSLIDKSVKIILVFPQIARDFNIIITQIFPTWIYRP